jgi:RNA polymerase sigma-70 factor, ECF subfamily
MFFSNQRDSVATRQTLLLRINADSPARELAWTEFYQRYAPIISHFARKVGVRPQDVADVIQEVMLGFFSASPKFVYDPSRGRFRGYLKTCVWRVFQENLGKRLRIDGRSVEQIDPSELRIDASWNDAWENEKLQQALGIVRERYLSRPDKLKTFRAFEMYAVLDLTAEEVARDLQISIDGVYQAKSRVSKAIRAAFEEIESEDG